MKVLLFTVFLLLSFQTQLLALPPNDLEPWRLYAIYEGGFQAGKDIASGLYGDNSLLNGCLEQSELKGWKDFGWDTNAIDTASKIYFWGCISSSTNIMSKDEFFSVLSVQR